MRRREKDNDSEATEPTMGSTASSETAPFGLDSSLSIDGNTSHHDSYNKGVFLRYLTADNDNSFFPGKGIIFLFFLGILISIILMDMTSDDYFIGYATEDAKDYEITFYNLQCDVDVLTTNTVEQEYFSGNYTNGKRPVEHHRGRNRRSIIKKVSGKVLPGRLTAVLGQSGSGKTTLLQRLLGRSKSFCAQEKGDIFLNGRYEKNGLESVLDKIGYVPQFDVLYADLTVEEAVRFSADWRLPKAFSEDRKQLIIDQVLRLLEIDHIRYQKIGSPKTQSYGYYGGASDDTSRISGGERKRTSIAVELVALPKVLLMDEPTSGLDSTSALNLVKILKQISSLGVTVFTILHQPSQKILELVDDVILMKKGEAAYVGPKSELGNYFELIGYDVDQRTGVPNAEDLLDILASLKVPSRPAELPMESLEKLPPGIDLESLTRCLSNTEADYCNDAVTDDAESTRLGFIFRAFDKVSEFGAIKTVNLSNTRPNIPSKELLEFDIYNTVSIGENSAHPTPGFKTQSMIWTWLLFKLNVKKGIISETISVFCLAAAVGFVGGYNRAWSRKPVANLFLSLSIGLLGMVGTIYNDETEPVQRAADSGMLIGAHEFAVLANNLMKGWLVCHSFSFAYFVALYAKTDVFIYDDVRATVVKKFVNWEKFNKYYEFAHVNHLNYIVSSAIGSAICVFCDHNQSLATVVAVAVLTACHVFGGFTPNENQVKYDGFLWGTDFSQLLMIVMKLSYVRYYLEAIFLWDPELQNHRARKVVLKYYSYGENNKSFACTCMFGLWTLFQSLRYVVFVMKNSNEFHSVHDTPLFIIFVGKMLTCHIVAFILMAILQDVYFPFLAKITGNISKTE